MIYTIAVDSGHPLIDMTVTNNAQRIAEELGHEGSHPFVVTVTADGRRSPPGGRTSTSCGWSAPRPHRPQRIASRLFSAPRRHASLAGRWRRGMVAKSLLKGLGLALVVALAIGAGAALGEGSGHEVTVAPQVTKVPDVVGLAPPKANRALSRHHLRHRYTALSNLCAGLPPAGHVLLQDPKAGTWVEERSLVRLQTSCAKSQRR